MDKKNEILKSVDSIIEYVEWHRPTIYRNNKSSQILTTVTYNDMLLIFEYFADQQDSY